MKAPTTPDVIVIGGGPAGLSAALMLGRACRSVLLAADGPPRNAPAVAVHNVFTRDGTPPAELLRIGREQLDPYDVHLREEHVAAVEHRPGAERASERFEVTFEGGDRAWARALLLATGIRDVLPDVPGFQSLWGTGIFHCPYCHGWEVRAKPLALYGRGEMALHLSTLLRGWSSDLMLFTDGPTELSAEEEAQITASGIRMRTERVERLDGAEGRLEAVVLEGGEAVERAGLFFHPHPKLRSGLAAGLGCTLTTGDDSFIPAGLVETDAQGRTSVAGVYAAGDAAGNLGAVITAAASGTMAAGALNYDWLAEDFEQDARDSAPQLEA